MVAVPLLMGLEEEEDGRGKENGTSRMEEKGEEDRMEMGTHHRRRRLSTLLVMKWLEDFRR